MKLSDKGLALILRFEGKHRFIGGGKYEAYLCPAGVWTIYAGLTEGVYQGMVITESQGEAMFRREITRFERAVDRLVKVKVTQNQYDALVSFAYNCGEGALAKSTLLRRLNAGDYEGAAGEFGKWNKGGGQVLRGLTRRRTEEAALFRSKSSRPTPRPTESPDPMPQQVDPPKADRKSIFERLWTWVSGSGIAGILATLTDWRVVLVIVLSLIFVGGSFILFMGPDRVRQWIREHVNR
jgi:lysozyme